MGGLRVPVPFYLPIPCILLSPYVFSFPKPDLRFNLDLHCVMPPPHSTGRVLPFVACLPCHGTVCFVYSLSLCVFIVSGDWSTRSQLAPSCILSVAAPILSLCASKGSTISDALRSAPTQC